MKYHHFKSYSAHLAGCDEIEVDRHFYSTTVNDDVLFVNILKKEGKDSWSVNQNQPSYTTYTFIESA